MKVIRVLARAARGIVFVLYFLRELVIANIEMAIEVVTPRNRMAPCIVRIAVQSRTPLEITTLGNLISLTPGTLTLEVTTEMDALFVHAINAPIPEKLEERVHKLERKLLEVLR